MLLKDAGVLIIPALTHIINLSIKSKSFPSIWKKGKVTPIFKVGNNTMPRNYRPITILCAVSKVLERIVHEQLYAFLRTGGQLVGSQSGFRKGYSMMTCLVDVLDNIYREVDRGGCC